jgi:hypothetical protein
MKVCQVAFTEECAEWLFSLTASQQEDILAVIGLLKALGAQLGYPYSSGIEGSKYSHMRELRIQHTGKPYRILYAFDPIRAAILLIGDNKTGKDRWYKKNIPKADKLYSAHLEDLKRGKKL